MVLFYIITILCTSNSQIQYQFSMKTTYGIQAYVCLFRLYIICLYFNSQKCVLTARNDFK